MRDLVVLSLEAWDEVWRRNQHLVAGLLRAGAVEQVLFVEPAVDTVHTLRRQGRLVRGRGLRQAVLDGVPAGTLWLWEPTKVLPRRLDRGYDRRWAAAVVRAAARAGLVDPMLWVNDAMGAELLDLTGLPTLYDVTDDWLAADRPPAEHARLADQERRLLDQADEVVVCSPGLASSKGAARPVHLVPNGVDRTAYQRDLPRPADLPGGQVLLYAGTVHPDRVDVDLLVDTARAVDGRARVVLLGPQLLARPDTDRLAAAGVVLLGPRPAREVPTYLVHADVLLVPHVVDAFTASLDPIKRYEYAAAGRPIVATAVSGFLDGVALTAPRSEFPALAGAVLADPGMAPDPSWAAAEADWSIRVGAMTEVLGRLPTTRRDRMAE